MNQIDRVFCPRDTNIPFFAYGIFKPGGLAFFGLQGLVDGVAPAEVKGALRVRDGMPILDPAGNGMVAGYLLTFDPDHAAEAYGAISQMEPRGHYLWDTVKVVGRNANLLVGKSPQRGSDILGSPWEVWADPLFTVALDVVDDILGDSQAFDWSLKPLVRLQMAYLLLWTSIERYLSLRYCLGDDVMKKVERLAQEPAFANSLMVNVSRKAVVFRADRPSQRVELDAHNPLKSVHFYYQVRSNISHRGKAAVRDHQLMSESLNELLSIFRDVLDAAKKDAERTLSRYSAGV